MAYLKVGSLNQSFTSFPSGHVIKHSVKAIKDTVNIISSGTAMFNSGIKHVHTTASSSTESYMIFDYYSGMTYKETDTSVIQMDITMTTASDTTYDQDDSCIEAAPSHYTMYIGSGRNDNYYGQEFGKTYIGLESGMGVPPNKTTWTAGETLYFRFWYSCNTGTYRITHASSIFNMSVTEIKR